MIRLLSYLIKYRIKDMVELVHNDKKEPLNCDIKLEGKTVVITGATSGIGYKTALLFASKGATLICINRSKEKSRKLEEEVINKYKTPISTIICDFSSLEEVKSCAKVILNLAITIDVFIPNAGVFYTKKTFTNDNIEMVFQVNHLSSFMLVYLLKEKFLKDNCTRIIYVNSEGHRFALGGVYTKDLRWKYHFYTGLRSYGSAKTAQLLTLLRFEEYFKDSKVTINAMHPGNVRTNIGENNGTRYLKYKEKYILKTARDPGDSAKALYYLSFFPGLEKVSGKFFNYTTQEKPAPHALDTKAINAVWDKSIELCGLNEV